MSSAVSIKDFIEADYNILHLHSGASIESCTTFLLAEDHFDEEVRAINGLFVSTFASPGSVLFMEGVGSFEPSFDQEYMRADFRINSPHIEHLLGWDINDYMAEVEAPSKAWQVAMLISMRARPSNASIDWKKEMHELFDWNLKDMSTVSERFIRQKELVRTSIDYFSEILTKYDADYIKPLQEHHRQVIEELEMLKQLLSPDEPLDMVRLRFLINKAEQVDSLLDYVTKMGNELTTSYALAAKLGERQSFVKNLHDPSGFFPKRTAAMIETLEKSRTTFSAHCFLIAGHAHLKEDSPEELSIRPERSLASLKTFLDLHPSVAVLSPKAYKE